MRWFALALLFLNLTALLPAQYDGRYNPPPASKDDPYPTFKGTFQSAGGGKLYLNTGDENQMEFWITRKTVILQGTKKIKLDNIKQGTPISVEAKLIVATHMDAVTIRVESPKN